MTRGWVGPVLVVVLAAGCASGGSSSNAFACRHASEVMSDTDAQVETYAANAPLESSSYTSGVSLLGPLISAASGSVKSSLEGLRSAYRSAASTVLSSTDGTPGGFQRVSGAEVSVDVRAAELEQQKAAPPTSPKASERGELSGF